MNLNVPVITNALRIISIMILTSSLTFLSVRYYDHINSLTEFNKMKTEYTAIKNQENTILLQQKQIAEEKLLEIKAKYEGDVPTIANETPY